MDIAEIVSSLIERRMKEYRVTGAGVSLIAGAETLFCRGFGFADADRGIGTTEDTIFRIGSITKVFTASAVLQLSEQGRIDVDKPVTEYVPEFSVKSRFPVTSEITVRDILCHHAGLPCDNLRGYFSGDATAFHSAIDFLRRSYLVCPPRTMFYYSNLGYEVLGVIISRVTGMQYHEYMENVFLTNVGMTKSAVLLSEERRQDLAKPYRKGKEQVEEMSKCIPEGGLHSTARDMTIFMNALLNEGEGIFKKKNTLGEMFAPQYPGNFMDMDFTNGLGWFIGKPGLDHAGRVVWHDGGTPHYFSLTILVPEQKTGITLLTNSTTGALMNHRVAVEILQAVLHKKQGISVPVDDGKTPVALTDDMRKKAAGRFFALTGLLTVAAAGKRLIVRMPSGTFLLIPCRDGWFSLRLLVCGILPLKLNALSFIRAGILEHNGQKIFALEQLGIKSPQGREYYTPKTSDAWKKRAGHYICRNERNPRLKSFVLKDTAEGLAIAIVVDKTGKLNIFLDIVNDSEAVTLGFGRYSGETIIAVDTTIHLFGLEFERKI